MKSVFSTFIKLKLFVVTVFLLTVSFWFALPDVNSKSVDWKMPSNFGKPLCLNSECSVKYANFKGIMPVLSKFTDLELVEIDLNDSELSVEPVMGSVLSRVDDLAQKNNAVAAVNAGFFDVSNGMSVSNVVINSKRVAIPEDNTNLTLNSAIKPYLKAIFNRSELKKLKCGTKTVFEIAPFNESVKNCTLTDALQGGPSLLPQPALEKEAFIAYKDGIKVRESANVTNPDARVAVGLINSDKMIWLVAKAGYENGKYYGLTIHELARLMKYFGVKSALAYDGGSSTSLYLSMPDSRKVLIVGDVDKKGNRIPAKVKSILIVKRK